MAADFAVGGAGLSVAARRTLFEGGCYAPEENATSAKYDVTPDGRRLLVARTIGQAKGEIVIWTGWLQGLKQQLTQARQ